jgi:hypothetical protein
LLTGLLIVLAVCVFTLPAAAQGPLQGFDPRCIEIDMGAAGANVFTDPGTTNDTPTCGNAFIDWADLTLAQHTIVDGIGNADPDIVGPQDKLVDGSTLPKEDIYNLFLSNNVSYLYLAQARRSNNGNSTYHWFFTKTSPTAVAGQPITFHLQNGDVEVRVCFPRGSDPGGASIGAFRVQGLGASQVVDASASNIWSTLGSHLASLPSAVSAFSINLAATQALPGSLDSHGDPTNTYDIACFGEGAISLSALGISPCNTQAFVTVMTRSSCSLTSALKDIAPPVEYIFGGLDVTAGAPTIACTGASGALVTITATASGGSGSFTWTWPAGWSHNESGNSSTGSKTLPAGSSTIHIEACDAAVPTCCADVDVPVTVLPQVTVSIGTPTIECTTDSGAQVTLTANASGGDGNYTYQWSEGGTPIGTDNPLVHTFSPGSHTVRVDIADGRGCTAWAQRTFTVLPKVTASIGTPVIECTAADGAQVTLTATPGGGDGNYSYQWTEGATDLGTTNPLVRKFSPGDHTVAVTVTDGKGCSAQAQTTFHVNAQVGVTINQPTIACTLEGVAATILTAVPSGGDGSYSYSWYEGATLLASSNPLNYSFAPGSHTVRVVVVDGEGCEAENQITFNVLPPVSVTLEIVSDLDCVSSVQLRATAAGGDENYTYTWYVDGLQVFVDSDSGGPSFYTLVFPDDQYCGTKVVSVSVHDSRNCANPAPNPSKTLEKTTAIADK